MHFEEFVNDFDEEDYESWYFNDATPKQKEKANRIREVEEPTDQPPEEKRTSAIRNFITAFKGLFKKK